MATYYEVLGVVPNASAAAVRAAYVAKARALHPDRQVGRSADEMQRAQRAMQDVNAAWAVLGDPRSRRSYDDSLRPGVETIAAAPPASRSVWPTVVLDDLDDEQDDIGGSALPFLVRVAPVVLLLGVLLAIFVITAYAAGSRYGDPRQYSDVDAGTPSVGSCVEVRGTEVVDVGCESAVALRVERVVQAGGDCGANAVPVPWDERETLCLRPPS